MARTGLLLFGNQRDGVVRDRDEQERETEEGDGGAGA